MTTIVRAAGEADLAALAALADAFYREDGFTTPTAVLRPRLERLAGSDTARVVLAREPGGSEIGFAVTTTVFGLEDGLVAELQDLYVRPDHRGRGLGRRLVADAVAWARSVGADVVDVVLAPSGGSPSGLDRFYADCGFADAGRRLRTWRA